MSLRCVEDGHRPNAMDDKQISEVPDSPPTDSALASGIISTRWRSWPEWMAEEVDMQFAYIPLLACCFTTGLTDVTMFNAYGTFVSMQTGNTIFIALGTSGQNSRPDDWVRSLCSLGIFVIGCFSFSRLHRLLGSSPCRRLALVCSFLLQSTFVTVAAATIQGGIVDGHVRATGGDIAWLALVPIGLLSFQAAGQITNSRGLGVGEVPTVVITSLLCDLVSDQKLFTGVAENAKRNRRVVAFVLTLLGAICGGWIYKATGDVQPSLWFVAAIKFVITLAWMFWAKK